MLYQIVYKLKDDEAKTIPFAAIQRQHRSNTAPTQLTAWGGRCKGSTLAPRIVTDYRFHNLSLPFNYARGRCHVAANKIATPSSPFFIWHLTIPFAAIQRQHRNNMAPTQLTAWGGRCKGSTLAPGIVTDYRFHNLSLPFNYARGRCHVAANKIATPSSPILAMPIA
ncbi:uncharacterized protein BX663DRAFT_487558 [Cokeromyces recurvatus]|uniref:uncharacterized protein n=1 Tax=Cokeromyces recurvatus TaxID=90255 RepID=UPI002220224C|nr:uncharacterized protein BX663DRAFT_487558 [Cokeromyces recurvatus]KAI7901398.1 hypothetical protein BX663DRAFT_487558 [Cokeromyces recurvatus]